MASAGNTANYIGRMETVDMSAELHMFGMILLILIINIGMVQGATERYRKPAPLEDAGPQIEEPVFGACAGHQGSDESMWVMEWIAKRTWHILGLPYERKDFIGPPPKALVFKDGWIEAGGTVSDGGVPCRNQVITAEVEQFDDPILINVRATDAFGEVFIILDLKKGTVEARTVTVSHSMEGGTSYSSPMPEQSFNKVIKTGVFDPVSGIVNIKIKTLGEDITMWANDKQIFVFKDPDPAGGKFGFGSVGRVRVRNIQQWELITAYEKQRREACIKEMHEFNKKIDTYYDGDVRKCNRVDISSDGLLWTWPATGATARFITEGPYIKSVVKAGLYGNDVLISGYFPEVMVIGKDGEEYLPDQSAKASITGDALRLNMTLPLASKSGKKATAHVLAKLTVQTTWFWTATVEGVEPKSLQMTIGLAPQFAMDDKALDTSEEPLLDLAPQKGGSVLRQNGKAGFYVQAIESYPITLGARHGGSLGITIDATKMRFLTTVLPAQPLNMVGFKNRMVHFIRYAEGDTQHWRRQPSYQNYPTNVDLARFAGHGTDAMVWHHTWLNSDFRDREGFFVNDQEMKRSMDETHRLNMKMIGYLGIVPGRNPLLRFEDLSPMFNSSKFGGYDKNWDLQDQTFYNNAGRYPEFITWMTDYWCKKYGLNGFYLDGGAFGAVSRGAAVGPLYPEDAGLSLQEIQHRTYYRVKKVLELNKAGYGLEPWSGLDWPLNGFYDCMMIGESFQEAPPEYYRDGYNALLTGCTIKMYGMRETSQNPYNIAMAAVNLSDIQVCSGNGAWGDVLDTTETWDRVQPLWNVYDSIDWDHMIDARPWYAQELVSGDGFYASNYTTPKRTIFFLANKTENAGDFKVKIDLAKLPKIDGTWQAKYCLNRTGDIGPLGDGNLTINLPALHGGPIGIELVAAK